MNQAADTRKAERTRIALFAWILFSSLAALAQEPGNTLAGDHRVRRHVVVSIPDRQLAVLEGATVIRTFPVAVGAAVSLSPVGELRIVSLVADPTYYHPGTVIPPGPNNPIGPRWVGLSQKGYGIHGTNEPDSIGKASSHGCIRMRNHDIKQFFAMVSVGDTVEIRAERDEQTTQIFGAGPMAEPQTLLLAAGQ